MRRLLFDWKICHCCWKNVFPPPTLAWKSLAEKNRCRVKTKFFFVFLFAQLDGWMAEWQMDLSRFELHNLKLLWCMFWITNTSKSVFFSTKGGFFCHFRKSWGELLSLIVETWNSAIESDDQKTLLKFFHRQLLKSSGSIRNNSDWWITSPLRFSTSLHLCWGHHFEKHYF